jgi:hypothetical protein
MYNKIKVGDRNGKRVILGPAPTSNPKYPRWYVQCDCGHITDLTGGQFRFKPNCIKCNPGGSKRKYGNRVIGSHSIYRIWAGMRHRCNPNATDPANVHWAGRGITICDEWDDFAVFEDWALDNGYKKGLSLDRTDVDGNYCPENCQFVTRSVNSKRARAEYTVLRKNKLPLLPAFYDEPCYGDF